MLTILITNFNYVFPVAVFISNNFSLYVFPVAVFISNNFSLYVFPVAVFISNNFSLYLFVVFFSLYLVGLYEYYKCIICSEVFLAIFLF